MPNKDENSPILAIFCHILATLSPLLACYSSSACFVPTAIQCAFLTACFSLTAAGGSLRRSQAAVVGQEHKQASAHTRARAPAFFLNSCLTETHARARCSSWPDTAAVARMRVHSRMGRKCCPKWTGGFHPVSALTLNTIDPCALNHDLFTSCL